MNPNDFAPELILVNGIFWTQDPNKPRIQAVAIANGRIIAVGDDDDMKPLARSRTKIINLGRRLGVPGMVDSHFHYYDWALGRQQLELADVKSFQELIERIAHGGTTFQPNASRWWSGEA